MSKKALGIAIAVLVSLSWMASAGSFEGSAEGQVTGQTPVPTGVQLDVEASGTATRLGSFTRTETLVLDPVTNTFSGVVTFTDEEGDTLVGTVAGSFVSAGAATGTYEWTSGTGRFVHPVGNARFVVNTLDGVHLTVAFRGTLSLIRPAS